jgi:invasion associated locus B (IalB) protein
MRRFPRFVLSVAIAALAAAPACAQSSATLLGAFGSWQAFQSTTPDGRVCYALSQPRAKEPAKAKRDPVYFLVSDWPTRGSKAEPEVVPGYQYKADSAVTIEIGGSKFDLFTRNEGGAGGAWVKEQAEETRLIDAMRRGSEAVVHGVSQHGTKTKDTYALGGLDQALDKIHAACGM